MDTVVLVEEDGMRGRSMHFFVTDIEFRSLERAVMLERGSVARLETPQACTGWCVSGVSTAKGIRLGEKNASTSVEAEGLPDFVLVHSSRCFTATCGAIDLGGGLVMVSLFGGGAASRITGAD
jgi:hypothetical protein